MTLQSILCHCLLATAVIFFGESHLIAQNLQPSPKTPVGWKRSTDRRKSATVFTKSDLKADETLVVKFYQRKPLESKQSLEQWITYRVTTGKAPRGGKWTGPAEVVRQTGNMIDASRRFKVGGKKYVLKGLAVGVDNINVRFAAVIRSDSSNVRKHRSEWDKLLYNLLSVEKAAALKEGRGTDIELNPPKVKNLSAGGTIKPGRYVGNMVNLRKKKAGTSYELIVFENGEYELTASNERKPESGRFAYSHATGRLNIEDGFKNSTYDPEGRVLCLRQRKNWQVCHLFS